MRRNTKSPFYEKLSSEPSQMRSEPLCVRGAHSFSGRPGAARRASPAAKYQTVTGILMPQPVIAMLPDI
jgi:hypothetical protein